jgi:hypothetical protein
MDMTHKGSQVKVLYGPPLSEIRTQGQRDVAIPLR